MKIYLHMLKQWSRSCKPGMTVAFDESKGRRVIAGGFAKEVPNPKLKAAEKKAEAKAIAESEAKVKAEAEADAKGKAETATANPVAETADARPNFKGKVQKPGQKK